MNNNSILRCINLTKKYNQPEETITAVNNLSFTINLGEFIIIGGESGSGKTTLLKLMSSLEKPTEGKVYYKDIDIYNVNNEQQSNLRANEFGFAFQAYNLLEEMTVYDNIAIPIMLSGKKVENSYIKQLTVKLGVEEKLKMYPNELSGGQQQRVALARAFINSPEILFADEPTGNLDTKNSKIIVGLLKEYCTDNNKTVVMVTHDRSLYDYGDRIVTLKDGGII